MNVLYATYPWAFETPGGGEIQLLNYEKYINNNRIRIVRNDPWLAQLDEVDLVHFFSCIGGSSHFCAYVKQRRIPLVVTSSLWLTERNKHEYPLSEISYQLSLADGILVNGESEKMSLVSVIGVDPGRIHVIRNGFDPIFSEEIGPASFRSAFNIDYDFILNIGNIEPRKNQLNLIRAAKCLGMRVVLIGAIRDQAYAERCISEGAENTVHIGYLKHDNALLRSAISAANVFCLPSTLETPGLAALEAAAAGARLVITQEGSTSEYFDQNAVYVDPQSVENIAEGILFAIKNPKSNHLKDHVCSKYTWPKVTRVLEDLYLGLKRN